MPPGTSGHAPMIDFYHDYLDPHCFEVELWIASAAGFEATPSGVARAVRASRVRRVPFETHPPPDPPGSRVGGDREAAARARLMDSGIPLASPLLTPWTRKAHEAVLIADEHDRAAELHAAILFGWHVDGIDIGRIDLLVEIATACGVSGPAMRVALDIDQATAGIIRMREAAERRGIHGVPTLLDSRDQQVAPTEEALSRALVTSD